MKVRLTPTTASLFALLSLPLQASAQISTSPKRGLAYVPSSEHPSDDTIWIQPNSDLTWYYNYSPNPTDSITQHASGLKTLTFVPQLWGVTNSTPSDDSNATPNFLYSTLGLINSGVKVPYVLAFNEPDGTSATGGSGVPADLAAQVWISEIQPLAGHGVKLGLPAVTGAPSGAQWLDAFFQACAGQCKPDFVPIHWYGNFEGLASHVGENRARFLNLTMWVTEWGFPGNDNLTDTQLFFNQSREFFDRIDYITHYSYFGAFRSDVSNVGPDEAMLTQDGKLTDIGSWYLGGGATGNVPKGEAARVYGARPVNDGWYRSWGLLLLAFAVWGLVDVWVG